jgi:hypothetical protein
MITPCRTVPGPYQRDQVRPVDRPPAVLGGLQQLEGHRQPRGLGARALGTRVRSRTVEKVDAIGLLVLRCTQCSAGKSENVSSASASSVIWPPPWAT